ncbi:MAG: ATP-dependent helicase [Bacteroidales bacterium]|nr:ATP-dependent helicase [Bacteroidales bacterium]
MDFIKDLNISQQEAVEYCDGPSLVIAGAGSGKTRVLTYKIAYLLEMGVKPYRILALTFTNKAALEMRNRIDLLLGNSISRYIWMNTFHSIFSRFLRTEAETLGFTSNFTIYDADDSKNLVKNLIKEMALSKDYYNEKIIAHRISTCKNNLVIPEIYHNNKEFFESDKLSNTPEFYNLYRLYVERCKKSNAMDFDDLLLYINIMFKDFPHLLEKYQNMFDYILVDEFQDTNISQYLIIKKLTEKNKRLCVVGDDAQSIYSFRGAKIENILKFQKDYQDCKLFKLEQNYRSTKNIVNLANSLIEKNKQKIHKLIFSENEEGAKIQIHTSQTDRLEGVYVTEKIQNMKLKYKFNNSDFVILYRANYQSRIFEEALLKANIPYQIYGGLSFYKRKEIKDILGYFRLIINQNDEEAFKRVVNYPSRKIGTTTIDKIFQYSTENQISYWDLICNIFQHNIEINSGTKKKLFDFAVFILLLRNKAQIANVYEIFTELMELSGIQNELTSDKTLEGVSRLENAIELQNSIKDFCSQIEKSENPSENKLANYLATVSLLTNNDNEEEINTDKIALMTIHSAKGLEFTNVFIIGMEDGVFPNSKTVESEREIEEERRLLYVAITRARKNLMISYSEIKFIHGNMTTMLPSRFLKELDTNFLSGMLLEKKQSFWGSNYGFENNYKSTDFGKINFFEKKIGKNEFSQKHSSENENYISAAKKLTSISKIQFNKDGMKNSNISVGNTIKHNIFGIGTVIELIEEENKKVIIDFNGEIKTLLLAFAKLEIID